MIARVFPPFQPVGHSIRAVKFIKYLPALGWLPVVLTVDDQMEYEFMRRVGSDVLLSEIQPQIRIYRTAAGEPSLKYLEKERAFGRRNWLTRLLVKLFGGARRWTLRTIILPDRYLTWLPIAVARGRQIVKSEDIDIIFATCPPHSVVLVGAFIKLLTGKALVLDYRDDWIDTPWHRAKSWISRVIERRMESWAVKLADKVILVTEVSRKAFIGRYPAEPEGKFLLISNGYDLGDFAALKAMPAAARNSKFTILHAGSLNESKNKWGRSAGGLFRAVHNLIQQMPELAGKLALVFAGDLPDGDRRLAEEMGLSGVIKGLGHLPHADVLRLTESADLLVAINYEGWSTLIPGKIYEYWAAAGPPILLLSCPGAASSLVERYGLGFTSEPSDVASIEQAILSVYRQSETGAPLRLNTAGIEAFDRRVLTNELAQALSKIVQR